MKKVLIIVACAVLAILFMSCDSQKFSNNESEQNCETDKFSEKVLNDVIEAIESNDSKKFANCFSVVSKNNIKANRKKTEEILDYYKGVCQNINYEYSTETDIIENSKHYKFIECLAFVKTSKGTYSFDFLICRNDEYKGLCSLILSTKDNRVTSDCSDYILDNFTHAEYFNKDYLGAFIV